MIKVRSPSGWVSPTVRAAGPGERVTWHPGQLVMKPRTKSVAADIGKVRRFDTQSVKCQGGVTERPADPELVGVDDHF